jgi:hypothetical protein
MHSASAYAAAFTFTLILSAVGFVPAARAQTIVVVGDGPNAAKAAVAPLGYGLAKAGTRPLPKRKLPPDARRAPLSDVEALLRGTRDLRADALVLVELVKEKRRVDMKLNVYAPDGRILWSREYPLKRGRLPAAAADAWAKRIVAIVRADRRRAKPPKPVAPEPPAQPPPPAEQPPPAVAPPPPAVAAPLAPAEPPAAPAAEVAAAPEHPDAKSFRWAMPRLELSLGGGPRWRSYSFCPGVEACGQKSLQTAGAVDFATTAPYIAAALELKFFPLSSSRSVLRGLGGALSYSRGTFETQVETTGGQQTIRSTDDEYALELMYRGALPLPWGEGYLGIRAGAQGRKFTLPESPIGTESARRVVPGIGLDAGTPLVWKMYLEASFLYLLSPTPGTVEQEAYGKTYVSSNGFTLSLAVGGQIGNTGFGYKLQGEYARYDDHFVGLGDRAAGGAAREGYSSASLFAQYRL